ncbi:type VII secretion protein [Amycolatopsis sp. MJM2582]|uniref:WXG100 family type VII secretion target n=1 Tax=Amycolatopsis TaxID=1813 RepID=UPI000502D1D7|nr:MULTISPECIES: WXG100 family type VII secretion target [unclassified Amycolatopsis]KFZ82816.1 type VII secretion protein [Amycolatopsis sp. MJM2582]RSN49797.1 WXG100 family type VII secretion target [Amycolatopsis sp. WAC 04197]
MAGGFTGTVEQFTQSEKRVTEVRVSMDQNLSKLRDNIEATRAGWTGDASIAFNNVMKRFDEAGRGLNQALQNIGDLLEQAGSKYNASEQQQQELINSVNKGFGVLG